ncbi:fatty acid desaturase [Paraburkholderia bannensis]|uniref:fatty acid desaturase n=1 Tax=Paraburkholderia bannensis TaxID=765414 RepID=UPI0038CD8110
MGWLAGTLLLGSRSLGLGVLVHDAAHYSLFTSRRANEWTGKWLFGSLPNVPYHAYRAGHLSHHRMAGTAEDPDLAFVDSYPANRWSMARKLLRDVSGINGVKNLAYQVANFRLKDQLPFLVSHAMLVGALVAFGHIGVYACWWLGQIFVLPAVMRLRVMGEHGAVKDHFSSDPRANTSTTRAGPIARLLCAPNFVNFHVEHHFAPGVPSYRLRHLHRLLKSRGCYDGWDCEASSYAAVIKRCTLPAGSRGTQHGHRRAKGALSNMQ